MKALIYVLAAILGVFGLVFVIAAMQAQMLPRLVIGAVCIVAAFTLVIVFRLRPVEHVHRMELDLPGKVEMKQTKCQQCGATLGTDSVKVAAGAIYVNCEYCGSSYQIEEEPKW